MLRVLGQVLKRGDAAELEGFCAALTEACAWADEAGDMSRFFTKAARRRIAATAVPSFAHLPLILGSDKKRLSKRTGATSAAE